MSPANSYTNKKTLRKVCIYTYTAIIPEHLFQRFGGVESTVTATGLVAVLFSAICCNSYSYMKIKFPALSTCLPPASLPWANPLTLLPSKSITSSAVTTVLWLPTAKSAVPLTVGTLRPLRAYVPHLSFHHSCWLQFLCYQG